MLTNDERAELAEYGLHKYEDAHPDSFDDAEIVVLDFLANLQHYCTREGMDFPRLLKMARRHYDEEKK